MMERFQNTVESQDREPSFNEKLNNLFQEALDKIKENPSRGALAGLFLLASAQEATADTSENVQSFFDANYSSYAEQSYTPSLREAIRLSENSEEFMSLIESEYQNESVEEQVAFLRDLGQQLGQQYNYDMLNDAETIDLSQEAMFQALRSGAISGMCGNIHTYMAEVAQKMGLEAWVQSVDQGIGEDAVGHITSGILVPDGDGQQIVWINYGSVIETGTDNYQDAIGAFESEHNLRLFPSNFSDAAHSLVRSQAQETIHELTGAGPERGNDNFVENGLTFDISEEMSSYTLKAGAFYVKYGEYENSNVDRYDPLVEATYKAAGVNGNIIDNEHARLGLQAEFGSLSFVTNNARMGETEAEYLTGQLGYSGELRGMTKHDIGTITHQIHMLGQAKGAIMFGERNVEIPEHLKDQYPELANGETEDAAFANIKNASGQMTNEIGYTAFFNPKESPNSFFLGASAEITVAANNAEAQDIGVWHTGTSVYAGATIEGHAGTFSISGEYTDGVAENSFDLAAGFSDGKISHNFSVGYTEMDAAVPGNNPSETEISYEWANGQDSITVGVIGEDGKVVEASLMFSRSF